MSSPRSSERLQSQKKTSFAVVARKSKEKAREKFTKNQSDVLVFLKENPHSSLQEAADALSLSLPGVKKIMAKLQTLEFITRVGSKRDGYWLVK